MSINIFRNQSELPRLPKLELVEDTSSWSHFDQAGVIRMFYKEISVADFKNCSTINIKVFSPQVALAQNGHSLSPVLYDMVGAKKIQVCSRQKINLAAGDKVNGEFVFTNSTGYFTGAPYSTDADTQDLQNALAGYYTSAETGVAASQFPTVVQNMLNLTDNATIVMLYAQVIPFGDEPLNPLNITISGNNI